MLAALLRVAAGLATIWGACLALPALAARAGWISPPSAAPFAGLLMVLALWPALHFSLQQELRRATSPLSCRRQDKSPAPLNWAISYWASLRFLFVLLLSLTLLAIVLSFLPRAAPPLVFQLGFCLLAIPALALTLNRPYGRFWLGFNNH